jgi:hypothetical protein
MLTVVKFVKNRARESDADTNSIVTHTLKKVGFLDNRYTGEVRPRPEEYWLVAIVRENQSSRGGCFILRPIRQVPEDELVPLLHGMYTLSQEEDAVILTPEDTDRPWVMSRNSKKALMRNEARALVINCGGVATWPRRRPPEDIMVQGSQRLLEDTDDETP